MKYLFLYWLIVCCFSVNQVLTKTVYEIDSKEITMSFKGQNQFSFSHNEPDLFLKNPYEIKIENLTTIPQYVVPNTICKAEPLAIILEELRPSLHFDYILNNPTFIYANPFLFYVNEQMNKIFFERLIFKEAGLKFEKFERNFLENSQLNIPKKALKSFYYDKPNKKLLFLINNSIFIIDLSDNLPELSKEKIDILKGISINETDDLNIYDSLIIYRNASEIIILFDQNKEYTFSSNQTIDHKSLNLSVELNITSFSYDEISKTLVISDYSNGIYFFILDEIQQNFNFKERINFAKVLEVSFFEKSLILIKEISKKNISSIVLEEYLNNEGQFKLNNEIFLASFPRYESLVRTRDFLMIREPNLIHVYRPGLQKDSTYLPTNEVYRDFHAENLLEIIPFSLENLFQSEAFFIGIYREQIKIYQPHIAPANFNCNLPENISLDKDFRFQVFLEVSFKYLNCLEKIIANDHNTQNYCQKKIIFKLNIMNSISTIMDSVLKSKLLQYMLTISVGSFFALCFLCLIALVLKKRYKRLKVEYEVLQNQLSQSDLMSSHHVKPKPENPSNDNNEKNKENE